MPRQRAEKKSLKCRVMRRKLGGKQLAEGAPTLESCLAGCACGSQWGGGWHSLSECCWTVDTVETSVGSVPSVCGFGLRIVAHLAHIIASISPKLLFLLLLPFLSLSSFRHPFCFPTPIPFLSSLPCPQRIEAYLTPSSFPLLSFPLHSERVTLGSPPQLH